jgi:hypothetical protein
MLSGQRSPRDSKRGIHLRQWDMLADVSLTEFIDLPQQGGADKEVLLWGLEILRHGEEARRTKLKCPKLGPRFTPTKRGIKGPK